MPPNRNGDGLRVTPSIGVNTVSVNTINGSNNNRALSGVIGATIAGGGCSGGAGCTATNRNSVDSDFGSIGGGNTNRAWFYSTVGGGFGNDAGGSYATVPGGVSNSAFGNYSFAAGRGAKAQSTDAVPVPHHGAFVWADSVGNNTTGQNFHSSAVDQFAVRARGGVVFKVASSGSANDAAPGCSIPAGGSASWSCSSDRNLKDGIQSISPSAVLRKVIAMPLTSWQFKGTSRRHMSPMAQDFWYAFGLGEDDRHITASDVSGVALAALQGLNQKLIADSKAKDAKISALERKASEIELLRAELITIKKKLGL
jgi:trimeric autotransporter adhesin